jgi:hypothetical protein
VQQKKDDGIPVLDDCPHRLARLEAKVAKLQEKADAWDIVATASHRLGLKYAELVKYVQERLRWRSTRR